jgi:cytidylate kinase
VNQPITIAIDGPAASGKSTVSQRLADRLGYLYLDTGCMYRAATLAALQAQIAPEDETAVTALAHTLQLDILSTNLPTDGRQYTVILNGQDITWAIRSPEVDAHVSQVASYIGVREEMVQRQRTFGQRGSVVMVGRDIGTVVMPNATLKFYITATAAERARRRWLDRQQQGHTEDYNTILADIERRDEIDSNREHSPLRPADNALIIDTTGLTIEQVIDELETLTRNQQPTTNNQQPTTNN